MNYTKVTRDASIEQVVVLAQEIWREYFIPIIGQAQVAYMLNTLQSHAAIARYIREGFYYFLIQHDTGEAIGYIGVVVRGDQLFLSKLYLLAAARGKGYGREALQFIEKLAKEKGCTKVTLTVYKHNQNAIKAYEQCGYATTGSLAQDIGEGFIMDDYTMEKSIA